MDQRLSTIPLSTLDDDRPITVVFTEATLKITENALIVAHSITTDQIEKDFIRKALLSVKLYGDRAR